MTPPSQSPPLKSFDLDKALAGDPVVTRDGRKVIRLAHFPEAPHKGCRLQVLLPGEEYPLNYHENGIPIVEDREHLSLFLAPKTRFARVVHVPGRCPEIVSLLPFDRREDAEAPPLDPHYKVLPAIEYEV